jgi:hypothetical protein
MQTFSLKKVDLKESSSESDSDDNQHIEFVNSTVEILYTLTLHQYTSKGRCVSIFSNLEWINPHDEVIDYIDSLNMEIAKTESLRFSNKCPFMVLSCNIVPTYFKQHLINRLTNNNKIVVLSNDKKNGETDYSEIEKCYKLINGVIKANNVFNGTLYFNDMFLNEKSNILLTIANLAIRKADLIKDPYLNLSRKHNIIGILINKNRNFQADRVRKQYFKMALEKKTIMGRIKKWINKAKDKIMENKRKEDIKDRRPRSPQRKPPVYKHHIKPPPGVKNRNQVKDRFVSCNWRDDRRKLILHHIYQTYDCYIVKRTWIRCVSDEWWNKNRFKENVLLLRNHVYGEEYTRIKKTLIDLKPHLLINMSDNQLIKYLLETKDNQIEMLNDIKVIYLMRVYFNKYVEY